MGTEKTPKKRSFIIRDVYKFYRSISKLWPCDKRKISSSSSSASSSSSPIDTNTKKRYEAKHKTKSKAKDDPRKDAVKDPPSSIFQEMREDDTEEARVSVCRVHSHRYGGSDLLRKKPSLSRSCSQNSGPLKRSLSRLKKSKSSDKVDAYGCTPSHLRTNSTTPNTTILYSTSSAAVAKVPPTEELLECTLEELCNGCTKMIKIKRDITTSIGEASEEEEMVKIQVKPGWKGGTKVTFEGKGNEGLGSLTADLTFVIAEKEHDLFKRDGDDLEMVLEIPLVEALTGCDLSVPLPDGDNMNLKIDDVIYPQYVTVIQGKGMPNVKEKGKRGDLRIMFRIKFPEDLTEDQRGEIRSILEDSTT